MTIHEKLNYIQQNLKAPKGQFNKFGNFNYRSCEDIMEAIKPLLGKTTLILSDETKELNGTLLIEATAKLSDGDNEIIVKSQAGIDLNEKGMKLSQSFGSSSSYARKYALNGLFAIDDTKDADTNESSSESKKSLPKPSPTVKPPTEGEDVKKAKLKKIEEIKDYILKKSGNDVKKAQDMLFEHAKVRSTELLKNKTFAQIMILHKKIIQPEI